MCTAFDTQPKFGYGIHLQLASEHHVNGITERNGPCPSKPCIKKKKKAGKKKGQGGQRVDAGYPKTAPCRHGWKKKKKNGPHHSAPKDALNSTPRTARACPPSSPPHPRPTPASHPPPPPHRRPPPDPRPCVQTRKTLPACRCPSDSRC